MGKASVLRGGNFSEVSYGRVSGDKSAGRFFVFIQKNIDKSLRVFCFRSRSRLDFYSQTEMDLESHRCIVNK